MSEKKAPLIWIVDDDVELNEMVKKYLSELGYKVRTLNDGGQLIALLQVQQPNLLILDLMLPGEDGLSLLRKIRQEDNNLPVLMLTARADGVDRIIGLEQGADDYLGKPFLPRELSARISAILRRKNYLPVGSPHADSLPIQFGDVEFNLETRILKRLNNVVNITTGEFSLLSALVQHPKRPLSRQRLIDLARGPDSITDERSIDVQISRLRRLVEADPSAPRFIQTVWGYGYVFVPDKTSYEK